MKKCLSFCALAFVSAMMIAGVTSPNDSKSVKAEDKYDLSFDTLVNQYDCCSTTNGWWDTAEVEDSIITLDFKDGDATYGYKNAGVMTFVEGRKYQLEFDLKATTIDGIAIYEVAPDREWIQLDFIENDGNYKNYKYQFVAKYSNSDIVFQQAGKYCAANLKNMYMFELSRPLANGETIGELPQYPEDASGWTIDGTTKLTSTSTFDFDEDKVCKPLYESSFVNGFTIDGTCLTEKLSGSSNFESTTLNEGELTLVGVTANAYWTDFVDVVAGETYYLVGKYKISEGSGVTIAVNNPWVTILPGVGEKTRQYKSFFYKYEPDFTGSVQMLFQCAYNNLGKSTINFKDVYFGKGFEVNYGSELPTLPTLPEDCDCWKIGNTIVSTGTMNTFASSENIYPTCVNPYYKVYFPVGEYVGDNAVSLDIPNVGEYDEKVLNVTEGHAYYITFELKTSDSCGVKPFIYHEIEGEEWEKVGYEGVNSTNEFTKIEYTYNADYTGELKLIIQNAYIDNGATLPVSFQVKNYKAFEVIKLHNGDTFENLPVCPIRLSNLWTISSWKIGDTVLTSESIFNEAKDTFITPVLEPTKFTLSFDVEGTTIDPIEVPYGSKLTNLPEPPEASKGHHNVWKIGEQEITNETVYSFETDMTASVVEKVNTYQITFIEVKNSGNTTLQTSSIDYGSTITFPDYSYNEDYLYHWEIDGQTVTEESTFDYEGNKDCKLISKKNQFMIYFTDANGSRLGKAFEIKKGQMYGEAIDTWPTAPAVEGYTFVGWAVNGVQIKNDDVFNFEQNIFVKATYVENEAESQDTQESKNKGCGGSVVASSIIVSSLALAGVCLLRGKKEQQ